MTNEMQIVLAYAVSIAANVGLGYLVYKIFKLAK